MEKKTTEEVAREHFEREEEERRNQRLLQLEQEEIQRREAEARELELEERRLAAREEADRLAEGRRELVGQVEEATRGLVGLLAAYIELDGRHRRALREAAVYVPPGDAKTDTAGYLGGELGPCVGAINSQRSGGSPTLAERDGLCPKG